jgi:hypothetical protein
MRLTPNLAATLALACDCTGLYYGRIANRYTCMTEGKMVNLDKKHCARLETLGAFTRDTLSAGREVQQVFVTDDARRTLQRWQKRRGGKA